MSNDLQAIRQLKHRYCHNIDRRRYDEVLDCFTEAGSFGRAGQDPFVGEDGLREFTEEVFDESYEYSAHIVTNPLIEVDGTAATGEWYLFILFELADGEVGWRHGYYTDEYREVDGEWLIESSVIEFQATRAFGGLTLE